jgi:hypothetical protein
MDYSNVFYYFYGDPLKDFARPFFAVVDNYLIASNSAIAVNQFYNDYVKGEFLVTDSAFVNFNQYLANESTIFYFVHNKNSNLWRKRFLKKVHSSAWSNRASKINDFYGFSWQWNADKDHFFTNFYAAYKIR